MTLMRLIVTAALIFFQSAIASAATEPLKAVVSLLKPYRSSGLTTISIEKKVISDLLGKTTVYSGNVFLAKGKIRWENEKPEKSWIICDGKILWTIQFPPEEFPGPVQVAKSKVDKKNKQQLVLTQLLTGDKIGDFFNISSLESKSQEYQIESKDPEIQIKNIKMKVDAANKKILSIEYVDEVGNKTEISFVKVVFSKKADSKKFNYQPPADAKVSDL